MRSGIILLSVGTLAGIIAARCKRAVMKDPSSYNRLRVLCLDGGWDDPVFEVLSDGEKVDLAGAPIEDLRENPEEYGTAFNQVLRSSLDVGVATLSAGPLLPSTMFAALLFQWHELETKLEQTIHDLLSLEERLDGIEVWVMGSVSSTTGRACWLEAAFCAHRMLRQQGIRNPIVNALAMDSEGLTPERHEERQLIEAAFWTELERAVASCPGEGIPRPHDLNVPEWTSGRPAVFTFRRNGKRRDSSLESVQDLADATTDWVLTTLLSPDVYAHVASPRGDRARALPTIGSTDGHAQDAKRRYLSVGNVAVLDLAIPSLKAYARSRGAEEMLSSVRGEIPSDVGHLATELQLFLGAIAQRFGEGALTAQVNRELNRLEHTLGQEKQDLWRGHTFAAQVNLDTHLDHARQTLPTRRRTVEEELTERIQQRLRLFLAPSDQIGAEEDTRTVTGIKGLIAYLDDVVEQLNQVRRAAETILTTAYKLDACHARIAETLGRLQWIRRSAQRNAIISEMRRGYSDAIRVLVSDHALRLVNDLSEFVAAETVVGHSVLNRLGEAIGRVAIVKRNAMAPNGGVLVRRLLDGEAEFEQVSNSSEVLAEEIIQTAKSGLLRTLSSDGRNSLAMLAACSAERLAEMALRAYEEKAPLERLSQLEFKHLFAEKYDNDTVQRELFSWLLQTGELLGGTLDPAYEQKTPVHARPAAIEMRKVLVPPDMLELVRERMVPVGLSPVGIQPVEGLTMIVFVHEKHGLPAWSFPYLRRISARLPQETSLLERFVTAQWALGGLPSLTHEGAQTKTGAGARAPFKGTNSQVKSGHRTKAYRR